jgi:hypothetical protein
MAGRTSRRSTTPWPAWLSPSRWTGWTMQPFPAGAAWVAPSARPPEHRDRLGRDARRNNRRQGHRTDQHSYAPHHYLPDTGSHGPRPESRHGGASPPLWGTSPPAPPVAVMRVTGQKVPGQKVTGPCPDRTGLVPWNGAAKARRKGLATSAVAAREATLQSAREAGPMVGLTAPRDANTTTAAARPRFPVPFATPGRAYPTTDPPHDHGCNLTSTPPEASRPLA